MSKPQFFSALKSATQLQTLYTYFMYSSQSSGYSTVFNFGRYFLGLTASHNETHTIWGEEIRNKFTNVMKKTIIIILRLKFSI